jgi:dTDP-4-dehydrorhamnose reductase
MGETIDEIHPDVIIHMAAVTHIDTCEMDKSNGNTGIVWRTNVEGTAAIARYCARTKTKIMYLSTECVFDGKRESFDEKAPKHPISWYGITKSEAEDRILASHAPSAIIRAVVAYHPGDDGRTIFGKLYNQLKYGGVVKAVDDQVFTPTYTYDIVAAVKQVVDRSANGIFHVAPAVRITPYEFALLIAKRYGFERSRITPVSMKQLYGAPAAALRLKHACLDGADTNAILHIKPKTPQEVLKK